MTEFIIACNDEWVPDYTEEAVAERFTAVTVLRSEMKDAGVLIFTGGLDGSPAFSVDASSGTPVFTDGPFAETKEHLGGFALVDVADEEEARLWAGKIAVACGWPQEVRRFGGATPRPNNECRSPGLFAGCGPLNSPEGRRVGPPAVGSPLLCEGGREVEPQPVGPARARRGQRRHVLGCGLGRA